MKKMFLSILRNLQENTCTEVSILIKLLLARINTQHQCFIKNNFPYKNKMLKKANGAIKLEY